MTVDVAKGCAFGADLLSVGHGLVALAAAKPASGPTKSCGVDARLGLDWFTLDPTHDASGYVIVDRVPSVAEYLALRLAVGWNQPDPIAARVALDQSVHGVCVELAGSAVAMARVVGDVALYLFIVDVVVHPDHQGQGVGHRMTERLVQLAVATAAPTLGLVAAADVADFYVGLGFDLSSDRYLRWPR